MVTGRLKCDGDNHSNHFVIALFGDFSGIGGCRSTALATLVVADSG
jgi:hypothetical protein